MVLLLHLAILNAQRSTKRQATAATPLTQLTLLFWLQILGSVLQRPERRPKAKRRQSKRTRRSGRASRRAMVHPTVTVKTGTDQADRTPLNAAQLTGNSLTPVHFSSWIHYVTINLVQVKGWKTSIALSNILSEAMFYHSTTALSVGLPPKISMPCANICIHNDASGRTLANQIRSLLTKPKAGF